MNSPYHRLSQALPGIKGLAILMVVLYHIWGYSEGYPTVAQIVEESLNAGLKGLIEGGLNIACLLGEQGVHFFLIASGFGLAASWWRRYGNAEQGERPLALVPFWRRRLGRIFPLYWLAHGVVLLLFVANKSWVPFGQEVWSQGPLGVAVAWIASLTTVRNFILPDYFFLNSAWWYIGLAVQLYLVFPLLVWVGRRWGWSTLLLGALAVSWVYRFAVIALPLGELATDVFVRGAFFLGRLFEFVFGMTIAIAILQGQGAKPEEGTVDVRSHPSASPLAGLYRWSLSLLMKRHWLPLTLLLWAAGVACDWASTAGWPLLRVPSDALIGVGEFCLACQLLTLMPQLGRLLSLPGRYSYGIYLTHTNLMVPLWAFGTVLPSYWLRLGIVALICLLIGSLFEGSYNWAKQRFWAENPV